MADPAVSPPEIAQIQPLDHSRRQLEALLEVSEAIAQQRDLSALFHELSVRGELAGFEVQQRFYEIGSPAGLADLEKYFGLHAEVGRT